VIKEHACSPGNGSENIVGKIEHSIAIRVCPGERSSGDTAVVRQVGDSTLLAAIVDVTGHGYEASKTAKKIEAILKKSRLASADQILYRLHDTLAATQGASVGLCMIDTEMGLLEYAGTGNTIFRRFGKQNTRLVSRDGIVGLNMRTPLLQKLSLNNRDLILMCTDGISERFRFDPGGNAQHEQTSIVVNKLIKEFGKSHDDAGCIALRYHDH